jgi:competence protein ComEC
VAIVEAKSSVPKKVKGATGCIAGESWEWSEVKFKIIHPPTLNHFRGNNGSCVVRVESANGDSFLITGDIEHEAEQLMVDNLDPEILNVDALVVPHHGSRTSSTERWLDLTTPRLAIFPVGYRNRFSFPKDDIVERYRKRGVKLWMSDDSGAVEVKLGGGEPTAWRDLNQRVWFTQ